MENDQNKAVRISVVIYTTISLAAALSFAIIASALGRYTPAAVYGGAMWVFLLTMIVTMPTITPWMKSRYKS